MAFRFYKNVIDHHGDISPMVVVNGDRLVVQDLDVALPRSCDYSLKDLLAAGVPGPPVGSAGGHGKCWARGVGENVIDNYNK